MPPLISQQFSILSYSVGDPVWESDGFAQILSNQAAYSACNNFPELLWIFSFNYRHQK